jgi:hypothetical protein
MPKLVVQPDEQATCEGEDCFIISYETSDPRADRFDRVGDDKFKSGPVPFPPQGDEFFDNPPFPELRNAAIRRYRTDRERYQTKSKGCRKGCECSASDDPADTKTSTFRREFSFQVEALAQVQPDIVVEWTVFASYQVKAKKTLGFCVLSGGAKNASIGDSGIAYEGLLRDAATRAKPRSKH